MNPHPLGLASGVGPDTGPIAATTALEELRCLSVEHRIAIVRAYYLNESVSDTAQRQGIPMDDVKSQLHLAAHALRIALRERSAPR